MARITDLGTRCQYNGLSYNGSLTLSNRHKQVCYINQNIWTKLHPYPFYLGIIYAGFTSSSFNVLKVIMNCFKMWNYALSNLKMYLFPFCFIKTNYQ